MSFESLTETIFKLTGKTPEEIATLAEQKGLFEPDTKAGKIVEWLQVEFDLGHGHSMALYGLFKHMGLVSSEKPKASSAKPKYVSKKSK